MYYYNYDQQALLEFSLGRSLISVTVRARQSENVHPDQFFGRNPKSLPVMDHGVEALFTVLAQVLTVARGFSQLVRRES